MLVGDYLLSKGLLLAVQHKQFDILEIVSTAVRELSEGELLQIEKARRLDISEDIYFQIIRQKTASLMAASCAAGASSAGVSSEIVAQMKYFGELAGIAFQIKDDLYDYRYQDIGKPTGIEIKEKKMTLPLIHALQKASKSEKNHIIHIIKEESHKVAVQKEVILFVQKYGGLEYAQSKMISYKDQALEILNKFEDNQAKSSLMDLVNFIVTRKN